MAFRYDFAKPSDPNRPLGSMIEQAEDLLFNLRYRREDPQEVKRPIFFVCHSFGALILKNVSRAYLFGLEQMMTLQALIIAKRRADFRDIFDSITGILFLACIHDERKLDLEQCLLWAATVELGLTSTKIRRDLLENLNRPAEWETVKNTMGGFKMLHLRFPVQTFCEAKPTVYISRPLRADKSHIASTLISHRSQE